MMKRLRWIRAAINTFPGAFRSGLYYFHKSWDTAIKLALLDGMKYGRRIAGPIPVPMFRRMPDHADED